MNFFNIGSGQSYFDDDRNEKILRRIAHKCYLPTNALILKLIEKYPQIKLTFSISGVALEAFESYAPEVLKSFRELADTGSVEFLSETYYHSLSYLAQGDEFEKQIWMHAEKIQEHFNVRPSVFRNTELIYDNELGKRIAALGFKGVFTDGVEQILGGNSPHHLFTHPEADELKIFLRNYNLSDDIAFRFNEHGLTVEKYMSWLNAIPKDENLVTIGLDYETFGEHQKSETLVNEFVKNLLITLAKQNTLKMVLPSEATAAIEPFGPLSVQKTISWADREKDTSAWLGNDMQRDALDTLLKLEPELKKINDQHLFHCWRHLQTSDHFYYMCTKQGSDGDVHSYFSPYSSPYEAFINFMNVLTDFSLLLKSYTPVVQAEYDVTDAEVEHRRMKEPLWAMTLATHGYHQHA